MNKSRNYIVSGLERSGTSLMMQILEKGEIPVAYDELRKKDIHNKKGYYELEEGKIINKLMKSTFPIRRYKNKFIKVTAFGLRYLPEGKYTIIFMERDIEEILDSMEKMYKESKKFERVETKELLEKLLKSTKSYLGIRHTFSSIYTLFVNYNNLINNPEKEIKLISAFLNTDISKGKVVVDENLYRNRRKK